MFPLLIETGRVTNNLDTPLIHVHVVVALCTYSYSFASDTCTLHTVVYLFLCSPLYHVSFNCVPCQICPASDEMVVVADKLTFYLSVLHSLELLLVDSIDIHQLQGRSSLPGQIHALEIRRSLGSLKVLIII